MSKYFIFISYYFNIVFKILGQVSTGNNKSLFLFSVDFPRMTFHELTFQESLSTWPRYLRTPFFQNIDCLAGRCLPCTQQKCGDYSEARGNKIHPKVELNMFDFTSMIFGLGRFCYLFIYKDRFGTYFILFLQTSKCHWFYSWAVGDDIADLFNLWKPRGFQHGLRLGLSSCSRRQPICVAMRCHYFCSVNLKFQCWTCSVANCTKWDPPKSCGPAKWIWGASFIATKGPLRVTVK